MALAQNEVKFLTEEDAQRIKAKLFSHWYGDHFNFCQAMTNLEELPTAERKRQREALRRRMAQPGLFLKETPFHLNVAIVNGRLVGGSIFH